MINMKYITGKKKKKKKIKKLKEKKKKKKKKTLFIEIISKFILLYIL